MSKHGLGRIMIPDLRDLNYQLPHPETISPVISKFWTITGPVLDQGDTPMCVGYGTTNFITAAPVVNPTPDPAKVYYDAQAYDGGALPHDGTTVRAAMKLLKSKGVVSEYNWAFDILTVINYVLERGPMVLGTNWYENMFNPDAGGNLSISGSLAGGHCYLAIGADQNHRNRGNSHGAFQILNSWGPGWGQNGRAWISFAGMKKLLSQQGEAAVAREVLESTSVRF